MRSAAGRIALKIIILLGCIACVITKAITDTESRRVFLRNQKLSREWGLLHNLFWSSSGNAFANITYGGFTLIIALMLISRFIDAKSRPSLVEKIFLTVGMLCYFAMGGVVFAAFDQVPSDLHDNAIILGSLSFFVAILMLIDLSDPMARHISDTTQTDVISLSEVPQELIKKEIKLINNNNNQSINDRSNVEIHKEPEQGQDVMDVTQNGDYHRNDPIDMVQTQIFPAVEQPIFEKILSPEKQRPLWKNVPNPRENMSKMEYINPNRRPPEYEYRSADRYYHNPAYHNNYSPPDSPKSSQSRYTGERMMVIRDYSRSSSAMASTRSQPNRSNFMDVRRYKNFDELRRYVDTSSAIRPGFVANAARLWDDRAKRSGDLNTVV